jgi:hypothetical protein
MDTACGQCPVAGRRRRAGHETRDYIFGHFRLTLESKKMLLLALQVYIKSDVLALSLHPAISPGLARGFRQQRNTLMVKSASIARKGHSES